MPRTTIALAVGGAVLATVATVATVAALTGPTGTGADEPREGSPTHTQGTIAPTTPDPSPASSPASTFTPARHHDWRTAIPAGLSVSAGLPEGGGDFQRVSEPVTGTFCDAGAFGVDDALDVRRDGASGPEYGDRRDLRVFADDRAAHDFVARASDVARGCPEERHGATRWLHSVAPVDGVGEESVRILQTYETDGMVNAGATWWDLIRVGNAVLLTATGGEYVPGETLGQGVREHEQLISPVVDAMCVFGAEGCPAADLIPASFPLAADWPAEGRAEPGPRYGLKGPNDHLPPLEWNYCDTRFAAGGAEDALRATWTNVEDYRGRELLAFTDMAAAGAFVESLVDYWKTCPRAAAGPGIEAVQAVRPLSLGDASSTLASWIEYDGEPGIGLTVVLAVRVGSTVLLDSTSNEGSAGQDRRSGVIAQTESQSDALGEVIDSMSDLPVGEG